MIERMLPTMFASYLSREQAERLVGALLEAGVPAEDLSVVVRTDPSPPGEKTHLCESRDGLAIVDSGEGNSPMFGHSAKETEGSFLYESRIGGGISTSSPDDDVSTVDEMDDSQTAAEEMSYPANAKSYSSQERLDVTRATNTGFFNTTDPGLEGLGLTDTGEESYGIHESDISSVIVPGVGLVIGDGALATSLVGAGVATEVGGAPAATILEYLEDTGVPYELAFMLAKDFRTGGAIVAIATPPGGLDLEITQRLLEENGARNVQMVEAVD